MTDALDAQTTRLARGHRIADAYYASLVPSGAVPFCAGPQQLRPAEGALPAGAAARQVDPLGLARQMHDLPPRIGNADVLREQAGVLRDVFAKYGLADRSAAHYQVLRVQPAGTSPETTPPLDVRVVNIVHTNYYDTDATHGREIDDDEESEAGQRNRAASSTSASLRSAEKQAVGAYMRYARADDSLLFSSTNSGDSSDSSSIVEEGSPEDEEEEEEEDDEEDQARAGTDTPRRTPFFSLRVMQRRFLGMGYHKNEVGTAIGLRFTKPWSCSQLVFPNGRVLGTGSDNALVDRLLLKHATCAYMRRLGVARILLKKRTSQNLVAKCRLPTKTGLCLGRLCRQLSDRAAPTQRFIGVVVHWAPATLLLFQYGNMLIIGTNSLRQLTESVAAVAPSVMANFRTPENEADEQALLADGALSHFPVRQLRPMLSTWNDPDEVQRRETNEARRKPKVRFMGGY